VNMLDRWTHAWVQTPLNLMAKKMPESITPDRVTLAGFTIGVVTIPMLAAGWYIPAMTMILVNRILDGLDGVLARLRTPTDAGGFLDITLDFIFYSANVMMRPLQSWISWVTSRAGMFLF